MGVDFGATPEPPIRLLWDDRDRYSTLTELGISLEFIQEQDFVASDRERPYFLDSSGVRFRILVVSLEVVLCVAVPPDFDPAELKLGTADFNNDVVVVEHFEGQVHRALLPPGSTNDLYAALLSQDAASLKVELQDGAAEVGLTWQQFDQHWFDSVDPSPPMEPRSALSALLGHVGRKRPRGR